MNENSILQKLAAGFIIYVILAFAGLLTLSDTAHASVSTGNPHAVNWNKHRGVIVKASVRAGIDPSDMAAIAYIESKFDGDTRRGLFQFEGRTWNALLKEYGPKYGLSRNTRMSNPMANALMAAELWKKNEGILKKSLGRDVSSSEIYTAHFLGVYGAVKMLKANPNRLARDVTPQQARYNKPHFYKNGRALSVREFKSKMAGMMANPKRTYGGEARAFATIHYNYDAFKTA